MLTRGFDRLRSGVAWVAVLALAGCVTVTAPSDAPPEPLEKGPTTTVEQEGELSEDLPTDEGPEAEEAADDVETSEAQDSDEAPETVPGWETVTQETSSGIARLTVIGCDPTVYGSGSGFLVASDLVVTAAHVVDEAITTTVAVDGEVREAVPLGIDVDADVALLALDEPVDGSYTFSWPDDEVELGSDVAALGFPFDRDLSVDSGTLSSYERGEGLEWVRFSADVNPGNSGGPVVDRSGDVVGIVSHRFTEINGHQADGFSYALSHVSARPLVDGWTQVSDTPAPPECATATDPSEFAVGGDLSDPDVAFAVLTLLAHGEAINHGSYDSAFAIFTPQMQEAMGGLEAWSSGLHSSYWTELTVTDSSATRGSVALRVTLRTEQAAEAGPSGLTCSDWDLSYTFLWDDSAQEFFIDEVTSNSDPVGCDQ